MTALVPSSRKLVVLLAATAALFSVACSGATDERPAFAAGDADYNLRESTPVATGCTAGEVQSCTIWLGQHGDLSNCVYGVDLCSAGEWTGCVDEQTMADNPDLYAQLTD